MAVHECLGCRFRESRDDGTAPVLEAIYRSAYWDVRTFSASQQDDRFRPDPVAARHGPSHNEPSAIHPAFGLTFAACG